MDVVVITPPVVSVTAQEARTVGVFSDDDDDAYVNALLAAAQSQIDGRDGWLRRAIGLQTLEVRVPARCQIDTSRLPFPPYVDTVSDTLSSDGRTRAFRYRAGYGAAPAKPLPPAIRHAIILMAGVLRGAVPTDESAVKRKTVEGVGSWDYSLPDDAATAMQNVASSLLKPFWMPVL